MKKLLVLCLLLAGCVAAPISRYTDICQRAGFSPGTWPHTDCTRKLAVYDNQRSQVGAPITGYTPNAYGPGVNADQYGRSFRWVPLDDPGHNDPLLNVRPDVYGPGIGQDQYGRPVRPLY